MSSTTLKSLILAAMPGFLKPYWQRVEASPLGYRLARGTFWSLVGTVISRSFTLVSSILVARMLGKVGMGELGIVQSTVGLFSAFAGLGMGLTATKYVAQHKKANPQKAGAMLSLSALVTWTGGFAMTLAMVALSPWFAMHAIAAPHLAGLLRVGSLLLLFGAVSGAQTGALAGFEAFRSIARVNFISGISSFPFMVGGAWWLGLDGAVLGFVASQALNCVVSHLALRQEARRAGVPFRGTLDEHDWNVLWRFSLPGTLSTLLTGPVIWASSALLVNRPGGYGEMGVFNATMSWWSLVGFLPGLLSQVLLPLLSTQVAESKQGGSRKLALLAIKANALSTIPIVLIVVVASPFIMALYGGEFRNGWPTLVVTVITAAIVALHGPAAQSLFAGDHMWPYFGMCLGWSALYLGGAFFLVDHGSLGLATARLIAYTLSSIAVFTFACRYCWCHVKVRNPDLGILTTD